MTSFGTQETRRLISNKTGGQILALDVVKHGSNGRGIVDVHEVAGQLQKLVSCDEEKGVAFAIDRIGNLGAGRLEVPNDRKGSQKIDNLLRNNPQLETQTAHGEPQIRTQKAILENSPRRVKKDRSFWWRRCISRKERRSLFQTRYSTTLRSICNPSLHHQRVPEPEPCF